MMHGSVHLRFELQPYTNYPGDRADIRVRAGVVGGTSVAYQVIPVPASAGAPTDRGAAGAGGSGTQGNPIVNVDIELDESGDDVLLEFETMTGIRAAEGPDSGAIVDGLRID
jgi:hypothetical protein